MSVWILCDAEGCTARCEPDITEGYERGDIDVDPDRGWAWSYREHYCPEHQANAPRTFSRWT